MNNQKEERNQIKDILRNMRKKGNKTIEQAAEELNVSRQTISNWESGKSIPDAISLTRFLKSYDPTLADFKKLLLRDEDKAQALDAPSNDWRRLLCNIYDETNCEYFNKIGLVYFEIDDVIKYILDETVKSINVENKSNKSNSSSSDAKEKTTGEDERKRDLAFALLFALTYSASEKDPDYPLLVTELAIRLKKKGYIVNLAEPNGQMSVIILDNKQRKQLDRLILEHFLIPETRLDEMTPTERLSLKAIQSEYDEIKQKLSKIEKNELEPLIFENGFYGGMPQEEYTLSLGYLSKDSNIHVVSDGKIYTTSTPEEMSKYIETLDERMKGLVDNKDSFFVLLNNWESECCFMPNGEPKEFEGIKLYGVDCTDGSNDKSGDSND